MLKLNMEIDGDGFEREADAYVSKVVEPGLVDAVNRIAELAVEALVEAMPRNLDRPNPFTLNAFKVKRATPRDLTAEVYAQPMQARYLTYVVDGGVRRVGDYATTAAGPLVPGKDATLDAYGNLPRDFVSRMLQDTYVSSAHLTPGKPPALVRHAPGRDVEALALIYEETVQRPKLPFLPIVRDVVERIMPDAIVTSLGSGSGT